MRNLEDIERDLAQAREALSSVEGTPAEVYSRIVGYYRSVRNWNLGKREEYSERRLYVTPDLKLSDAIGAAPSPVSMAAVEPELMASDTGPAATGTKLMLFFRALCPACPPAKAAAWRLGIPVELVNADTAEGMALAEQYNVLSTPTAILFSRDGEELRRARDAQTIEKLVSAPSACGEPVAV